MSKHHRADPFLDAMIRFDNLPAEGRKLHVTASEEQRDVLAGELGITTLEKLEADLSATPFRGGVRIEGDVRARTVQPCVVTFEPVVQEIIEPVDRILLPGAEKAYSGPAGAEVFVDLERDDLPDYVDGPELDLTSIITETVALALDPYPRAPGASIDAIEVAHDAPEPSPFAALQRLKNES